MKKKTAIFFTFIIVLLIGAALSLFLFFVKTEAPIIKGDITFNVPYNGKHLLDIYHPTRKVHDKSPVLLFIHGGAWITGRKESLNVNRFNGAINTLRDSGYTVISPAYTLADDGKSPFPDCIIDGYDAIRWVTENADSLNLDIHNFGIMGESAGAHIAMMNAFADPKVFDREESGFPFDYLINIYGPNDLLQLYHSNTVDTLEKILQTLPEPMQEKLDLPKLLFGFDPEEDSLRTYEFAYFYSPVSYLREKLPPMLLIHGDQDHLVPIEQSLSLKAHLDSTANLNELHVLPNVDHAFINASDMQKDSVQYWISTFVLKQYNPQ